MFTIMLGQCEKPMKNRIEDDECFEMAELNSDVVALLHMIKDVVFDSNDQKYPPKQAARAWKNLCMAKQGDEKDLVDYYKWFMVLVEMVERSYGEVALDEVAKKEKEDSKKKNEKLQWARNKTLAYMVVDGASKMQFGYMMKNLQNDYALNAGKYPKSVEDGLQVLVLYGETVSKKKLSKSNRNDDDDMKLSFAQNGKRKLVCWKCKKEVHTKKECP